MGLVAGQIAYANIFGQYRQVQTGTGVASFTTVATFTLAQVFPVAFSAAPMVLNPNIDNAAGVTAHWVARAIGITTTGFNIFLFTLDGITATWSNVNVSWAAVSRT
jgi:hypothetical protein